MQEKVYFYLFILCIILPLGIFGKFLEDDIGEKSNVLVREKRVISRIPEEDIPLIIGAAPYIVNIKKNRRQHCIGSIISRLTVITAARCVVADQRNYEILSSTINANKGVSHNITHKVMHGHDPSRSSTFLTGIALIIVSPPFAHNIISSPISLYKEPILTGMTGTITGWASFVYGGQSQSKCAHKLRSINVSIVNREECRNIYRGHYPITMEEFCTHHPQRQCGLTDTGAPFVVDNKLVGVHIGRIDTEGRELPIKPDVFVLLQHPEYSHWIDRNIVL